MMEVKNIGNHNTNLIEDTGNQNTNSWCSLFLLGLKLKTKQCKELRSWSLPKQQCSNHLWSKVKHLESNSDVHVHCIVAWILHHERKFDTLFCCSVACILHHHCKKPQNNIFHINNPQSKKSNLTLTSNPKPWCLALVCVVDVCPTNASWHFAKHDTCQGMDRYGHDICIRETRPAQVRYCAFFHWLMPSSQGTQYPGFCPGWYPDENRYPTTTGSIALMCRWKPCWPSVTELD